MPFTIIHRIENDLQLIVLVDQKTGTEVSVLPSFGALLHSFALQTNDGLFNIIDNYNSLQQVKEELTDSHKSAKLSPFVCRIKEGKYSFGGRDFEFMNKFPDGSAIHGLLVKKSFEIIGESVTETSASVSMKYDYKKDDAGYPFYYRCTVKYQLKENGILTVETMVMNKGRDEMPLADGWHPYFTLGGKTDDWELSFQSGQMIEFDEKLTPTGKLVPNKKFNKPEKIGDTVLDNCFLLDPFNGRAACSLKNPNTGLELLFFPKDEYPYLQIYTPPNRKSIAIENLSSAPDSFNNGMGLMVLDAGQSQVFTLSYQLLVSQ